MPPVKGGRMGNNEDCKKIDEETVWALGKMLNINTEKLRNRTVQEEGGRSDMCRAIEELIEDGRVEGKIEGRVEGILEGDASRIVKSIESVMKNLRVEVARACEIIGVTIEEYQKAKGL